MTKLFLQKNEEIETDESLNEQIESTVQETVDVIESEITVESQPEIEEVPEWREFLVEYEEWVDEYIEVVNDYKANPTDMTILTDYMDMVNEMADWSTKTSEMELEITNQEDIAEYSKELMRIAGKLTDIA